MQRAPEWWSALVTTLIVYGLAWGFGVLVRRRVVAATEAVRAAERAAGLDIEAIASNAAADERRRAAQGTIDDLRDALAGIAASAAGSPAPTAATTAKETTETTETTVPPPTSAATRLQAIRRAADDAIARLHFELGVLSRDASVAAAGEPARRAQPVRHSAVGHAMSETNVGSIALRVLGMLAASALMLAVSQALGGTWWRPAFLAPAVLLPIAVALARCVPLASGALATVAFAAAALDVPHPPGALIPSGAAFSVLCWRFACDIDVRGPWRATLASKVGLALTVVSALVLAAHHGRTGIGFIALAAALAVFGANAWAERDRVTQLEETRAARLIARAATVQVGAEREERRRIARELHDIVSHAVVGISLQAQAALALSLPLNAALATIAEVASAARDELDALAHRIQTPAVRPTLVDLVDRGHALGLEVTAEFDEASALDPLAFRIVRESLTNAARYAPGSHVVVRAIERDGDREVLVSNGPPAAPTSPGLQPGRGSGLGGLADEIASRGGSFESGPAASGFTNFARYPAPHTAAPPPRLTPPLNVGDATHAADDTPLSHPLGHSPRRPGTVPAPPRRAGPASLEEQP